MTSFPTSGVDPTWYCVLNRECRLLYLGTSQGDALRVAGEIGIVGRASRMGDAMRYAAAALATARRAT